MLLAVLEILLLSLLLLPVTAADFAVFIINDDLDVDLRREDVFCLLKDNSPGRLPSPCLSCGCCCCLLFEVVAIFLPTDGEARPYPDDFTGRHFPFFFAVDVLML